MFPLSNPRCCLRFKLLLAKEREGGQRENTATAFDYICYPLIIVIERGRDKSDYTREGSNWLSGFKDAITSPEEQGYTQVTFTNFNGAEGNHTLE